MTLSPKIRNLPRQFCALPLWAQALGIVVLSRLFVVMLYLVWQRHYGESATLFEALFRYDCAYYKEIAQSGYIGEAVAHLGSGQAHWAFFPLAPLLEGIAARLTGLDVSVAGVLLNTVFLYLLTWLSGSYAVRYAGGERSALLIMLLFNFGPYNIYYSTLYTEALFTLLVCAFLYCMRRGWWIRMGLCGALAGAARSLGVFLVFAVAVFCIQQYLSHCRASKEKPKFLDFVLTVLRQPRLILGTCLVPLGFFCYMAYLDRLLGDGMALVHVQIGWSREPGNPLLILLSGLNTLGANEFYFALWTLAALYLCCHLALRKSADAVPGFLFVLIPLSTSILCMPRYVACSFPIVEEEAVVLLEKKPLEKGFWYIFLLLLGVITTWQWFCNAPVMA